MRDLWLLILCISITLFSSCSRAKNKKIAAPGQTLMNVPYATAPDTANKQQTLTMDIYLPAMDEDDTAKYPLMLLIHGGGFNEGDKKDMASHCSILADSGYVGVTINYRLGWRRGKEPCDGDTLSQYRALYRAVQDANAALRFLVSKAGEYHIDTSHIYVGGGSAGGAIALYTKYMESAFAKQTYPGLYHTLGAIDTSGNSLTNSFSIKGLLNLWGSTKDSTIITRRNAVPTIFFHGMEDNSSPYDAGYEFSCTAYPKTYGSACLARQLARYDVPYLLHLKQKGAHAPAAYKAKFVMPLTIRFFNDVASNKPMASSTIVE